MINFSVITRVFLKIYLRGFSVTSGLNKSKVECIYADFNLFVHTVFEKSQKIKRKFKIFLLEKILKKD